MSLSRYDSLIHGRGGWEVEVGVRRCIDRPSDGLMDSLFAQKAAAQTPTQTLSI